MKNGIPFKSQIYGIRRAFKHVSLEVADRVAAGSIRIGTFSHYREQEGARADPLEGASMLHTENFVAPTQLSVHQAQRLAMGGIFIDGAPGFRIDKIKIVQGMAPAYLYCCSSEPDFDYARATGQAIFEIMDLSKFRRAVAAAAPDVLGSGVTGRVHYQPRASELFLEEPIRPDPFVKDPKLAWEKEIRVVWPAKQPEHEPMLDLDVPAVAPFLHRLA